MEKPTFALAWEKWKETEIARRGLRYDTLTKGDYLENRIFLAFQAGYKVALTAVREEEQS